MNFTQAQSAGSAREEQLSFWEKDPRENKLWLTGALLLTFIGGFLATELVFLSLFGSL